MSREELLITLDKSKRNFKKLSKNGLEQIAKMKNISQNELEQIIKMLNVLQNELEQIAKMRRIKDYKTMSNEGLLSLAELYKSKSNNAELEEIKKFFNEWRDKFSRSKIKEIRKKFYKKEKIEQYFKELEKNNISKKEEKKVKKYHKKQEKNKQYLKELKENINKSKKGYAFDDWDYKGIRDRKFIWWSWWRTLLQTCKN